VIPNFDSHGNLPPGIHDATLAEVQTRFAYNDKRTKLLNALKRVISILIECKCQEVFLNGSFITNKEEPGDYDLCYEPTGIVATDNLQMFLKTREARKEEYLGDIFVRLPQPPYLADYVEMWQTDTRQDDIPKGIIRIDLRLKDNAQK
jgi:hypothetical protein